MHSCAAAPLHGLLMDRTRGSAERQWLARWSTQMMSLLRKVDANLTVQWTIIRVCALPGDASRMTAHFPQSGQHPVRAVRALVSHVLCLLSLRFCPHRFDACRQWYAGCNVEQTTASYGVKGVPSPTNYP